ncbi:spore coat protein YlbD [Scopulibacillus cellulosilyticus]|uniref:Spore coat protein YlbD n=1 Tax=Scopulibacillus cellulosilyticus TaxID=2665665 RepID=A0ABW2PSP8_9BACL
MAHKTADSVKAFKQFVQKHPELAKGVKEQGKTWNDIFDEWVLYGEDNEVWETYGVKMEKQKPQPDPLKKILSFINGIDAKNLEERLGQLNGALTSIQELIGQFQPKKPSQNAPQLPQNTMQNIPQNMPPNMRNQPFPPYQRYIQQPSQPIQYLNKKD